MNRIKELRKKNGKTQQEIADILHVNRTTIVKWETGKHNPDVDTLKILADYFDVSIDYLLGNSDIKNNNISDISTEDALIIYIRNMLGRDPTEEELKRYLDMTKLFFNIKD